MAVGRVELPPAGEAAGEHSGSYAASSRSIAFANMWSIFPLMLHEFLTANKGAIIERTRAKVAERSAPRPTAEELQQGIPLFLNQLIENLRLSTRGTSKAITESATLHGGDLLKMGLTVAHVVHDYGDLCQAVTALADEMHAPITAAEFQIFNGCLDDAIANAVTEYVLQRQRSNTVEGNERLGFLAHELRNHLSAATLSFEILKKGSVGIGGSTGAVLGRSLLGIRDLIDRSLAEVRLEAGLYKRERVSVSELMADVEVEAALGASERGIELSFAPVESGIYIEIDRPIIAAAIMNLLQNAFKFSHAHGHVSMRATATTDRVLFEIEDECGGLPPGKAEELFRPFEQRSNNRTGLGLGLSISRKGIEANHGELRVRDLPGKGCVFTIDLPRQPAP